MLDVTAETAELAATLIEQVPLPAQAAADAAHIAVAAYHGIDFVLTWNVAHIVERRVSSTGRKCVS